MRGARRGVRAVIARHAMDYEISVSEDRAYVSARILKPTTRSLVVEMNTRMVERAREHGISRFLFDVRGSVNVEAPLGNYLIAYEDAEKVGFERSWRFAILHDPKDPSHDFVRTVAKNAGYNLELFTEEQAAIEWLCK
jgi:hypothetical protein